MELLYVDALNYWNRFLSLRDWNLEHSFQTISKFLNAARNSNFEVSVFIDASIQSEEGKKKWMQRRAVEVRKMERRAPQGLQTILGDMFTELGAKVYYSVETDLDDALACFAEADGAAILSADNDFWRYDGATFRLFKDFTISWGELHLVPHDGHLKPGVARRPLGPAPKMEDRSPCFIDVKRTGQYVRGAPSPLVKLLGNPHAWVRPLRQALYVRFGISGVVREVFPSWDAAAAQVVWSEDEVVPDDTMGHLLEDPLQAIQILVPDLGEVPEGIDGEQWWKHVFAVHAIVHELCCAAQGSSLFRALMHDEALWATSRARRGKGKPRGKGSNAGRGKGKSSFEFGGRGSGKGNRGKNGYVEGKGSQK